jgi:hypothetical protein
MSRIWAIDFIPWTHTRDSAGDILPLKFDAAMRKDYVQIVKLLWS